MLPGAVVGAGSVATSKGTRRNVAEVIDWGAEFAVLAPLTAQEPESVDGVASEMNPKVKTTTANTF